MQRSTRVKNPPAKLTDDGLFVFDLGRLSKMTGVPVEILNERTKEFVRAGAIVRKRVGNVVHFELPRRAEN